MADSPCFELACEVLERDTALGRLEARGTIRLTLKAAGLDARDVTPEQMGMAVDKLLPRELAARGVANGGAICAAVKAKLVGVKSSRSGDSPEAVFARLGGGRAG